MLNLETFFKNYFDSTRISDDHLKEFSEDHIQRLIIGNSSGMFNEILTDIQTDYSDYFGNISDEDLKTAVRQSLTLSADNLISDFKSATSQKEGTIKGLFAATSPTYLEFFPHGLTEYHDATKANVETLMNRMMNSAIAHQDDLGNDFVQLFTDFHNNYVLARTAQLGKKADVATHKTATKTSRTVLELQLTKNIHFIGYNFPGDINHAMSFFDQSIIHPINHNTTIGRAAGLIHASSATGAPIKDALIDFVDVTVTHRKSKVDGSYHSANIPLGTHTIRVTKPGFRDFTSTITIGAAGDNAMDIVMIPGE